MIMKKRNVFFAFMVLVPLLNFGQLKFEQTLMLNNDDYLYSADLVSANSTYISAGYTDVNSAITGSDILVVNWNNISMGPNWVNRYYGPRGGTDIARKIIKTSDGGYLAVGNTTSYRGGSNEAFVLKLNSSGYVSSYKLLGDVAADYAFSCCENDSNYYVLSRFCRSGSSITDGVITCYKKSTMNQVWGKRYSRTLLDTTITWSSIIVGNDGNLIVAGACYKSYYYYCCAKINPTNGIVIWCNYYTGANGLCLNVAKAANNIGYILTGFRYFMGTANYNDVFLLRISEYGNVLWANRYDGNTGAGNTEDNGLQTIYNSTTASYSTFGVTNSFGSDDLFLMKTDTLGSTAWVRTYHTSSTNEGAYSFHNVSDGLIDMGSDGYAMVSGQIRPGGSTYDSYMLRANSSGSTGCDSTHSFTRTAMNITKNSMHLDTVLVTTRDSVITRVVINKLTYDTICSPTSLGTPKSMILSNVNEGDSKSAALGIFPNPSTGIVHFTLNNIVSTYVDVMIYDFMGKLVYSSKVNKFDLIDYSVNLTNKGKGLFFVKIIDGIRTTTGKFIIN